MLDHVAITKIALETAIASLSVAAVEGVTCQAATDLDGHDAVRITIILKPGAVDKVSGDQVLDTLVDMQTALRINGEERLAIVDYATQEELEHVGDP